MAGEADWYVLEVAPHRELLFTDDDSGRIERSVRSDLDKMGLMTIVPTEKRTRRVLGPQNRPLLKIVAAPLIPGYVFMGSKSEIDWRRVRAIDHVRGVIKSDGRPARLSDADMVAIDRLVKEERAVTGTLAVGDKARILRGGLRSMEAIVRHIRPDLVRVSLVLFCAEREVDVTPENVEKV